MPDQNNTIRVVAQLGLLVYWWRFIEQNKERLSQTSLQDKYLVSCQHDDWVCADVRRDLFSESGDIYRVQKTKPYLCQVASSFRFSHVLAEA